ncbi:hypothetical protein [Moritella sp.]|uniref:hypothetical protein n=1 Tax=Moritella sp. TaxID=78556 RepID=UPI0025EE6E7A|nr:hypothetical protein [Moritella sp.]MCJ8349870.1 hypothetical protein [Moritella sp.]
MQYRADKMAGGMKSASINRNQTRLSSVFSALIKAEIKQLLASLSGDELHIAKLCSSTGARWSGFACFTTFVCESFYDDRWQYINVTEDLGTCHHNVNHDILTPCTRLSK